MKYRTIIALNFFLIEHALTYDLSVNGQGYPIVDTVTPIEWVQILKKRPRTVAVSLDRKVDARKWIISGDLVKLGELLEDGTQCAGISSALSSNSGNFGSTVGEQVAILILAHRDGVYPPKNFLDSWSGSRNRRVEARAYLEKWKRK